MTMVRFFKLARKYDWSSAQMLKISWGEKITAGGKNLTKKFGFFELWSVPFSLCFFVQFFAFHLSIVRIGVRMLAYCVFYANKGMLRFSSACFELCFDPFLFIVVGIFWFHCYLQCRILIYGIQICEKTLIYGI